VFVEGIFLNVLMHSFQFVMGIILTFNRKYVFIFLALCGVAATKFEVPKV